MIQQNFDSLIEQISSNSGKQIEEVKSLINKKLVELQDLVSKEGAAHIVANELGVKLFQASNAPKDFKVNELQLGYNSVNIICKVISIYEIRSFSNEKRSGRVASMLTGDETGKTRVTVWDDNLINEIPKLKEGDVIKISNGYVRENNGFKEVHLGSKSQLVINPVGVEVSVKSMNEDFKLIKELKVDEIGNVFATVIDIFEPRYYDACPTCNKKTTEAQCKDHGQVTPKNLGMINLILDDGSDNIRATCFREVANKIINNETLFENIKKEHLGKQAVFRGKKTKNEMYASEDFIVLTITEINPKEFIKQYVS